MKVESIKIKNFKAISEENLEVNGNNVYLIGQNGVGKTSFIDAIFKIISGKELPSKLTKEGQKSGKVEIDLGEYLIKAAFNEKNEKIGLSIESKDGALYKEPRTMLNSLAGVVDFDINTFFNLAPKKQVDFIKNITGIDFSDLEDDYKKLYDERTFVNKRVKELEAQLEVIDFSVTDKELIDISELQKIIQDSTKSNLKVNEVKTRLTERIKKIQDLETELTHLSTLQQEAEEWLIKNAEIDLTELNDKMSKAIENNSDFEKLKANKEKKADLVLLTKQQEDLNINLKSIEEDKVRIISEAKIPVPGLTFDEDQLLYNGLPFEKSQINTAQQIIVGLQINLALLKDIKIARFDGSLLDNKNIKIVEEWAKENGLQLFVEFVERNSEGLKIEIKEEVAA